MTAGVGHLQAWLAFKRGNCMRLRMCSVLLVAWAIVGSCLLAFQSPVATYTHDAAGRLTSITDQSGNSAVYSYDAVGNLLSIARNTAPTGTVATPSFSTRLSRSMPDLRSGP